MIKAAENIDKISLPFPVVGIGASAGGLEAIKLFLKNIPKKSGMAYVFVQHLSPNHVSALPDILQTISKIPVHTITDNIHLEPDNLYIIPSNKIVKAVDGVLKLDPLDEKRNKTKVIDVFFSSLAVVHQSFSVGIILSGTLNDGSLGLQVIKTYGGMTFAQDESSAAFEGMPKNAVKTGAVDFVLSPDRIAEHLIAINHPFRDYSQTEKGKTVPQQDEEVFKQILTVLRIRKGVDFMYYKPSTLKRRIVRRMALNKQEKPANYLPFLRENKAEQDALFNDMLISVTNFFRDPKSFELLCRTIFPILINQKKAQEPLRIWVAGCATGEEAYSMAMCVHEYLGNRLGSIKVQIFATDISETAISKARTGIYKTSDLEDVSPSRLQQFFNKLDGNYQVNKTIRDMCVFANHNLIKDPPFSKIDMISCRNVMIYLEPILQKRVLTTFHYSLNEHGFLMLGKSESVSTNTDLFSTYNNREKVFAKKGSRGRFMQVASPKREDSFKELDRSVLEDSGYKNIFKAAEELLLASYTPAGVLVNDEFDIIQFRGETDDWLTPFPGKATLNILKMAREGLSFELRNILHKAKKTNTPVRKEGVFYKIKNLQKYVDIEAVPLKDASDPHFLILFKNSTLSDMYVQPSGYLSSSKLNEDPRDLRIDQLESELSQLREDMRAITEEQEASNEELQSSNQELLSGSEELQSINEELETSKEELQSTNEEIIIVNNELLDRNSQLNNARQYTEAIINIIRDPLIILDKDLRVKRATAGFYEKFKVTEKEAEGSYFYEFSNKQWNIPAVRDLLESVLPEKKVSVNLEVIHNFLSIGRRILILNARQMESVNGEPLILLAIEDITDKRKVEEGLAEVEQLFAESKERLLVANRLQAEKDERIRLATQAAQLGTFDMDVAKGTLDWDTRTRELFGIKNNDPVTYEQHFLNGLHEDDRDKVIKTIDKVFDKKQSNGEYDVEYRTIGLEDKKLRWVRAKGKCYFDEQNKPVRFVGTILDITDKKQEEIRKSDFIGMVSHELKTPLTSLQAYMQVLAAKAKKLNDTFIIEALEKSNNQINKMTTLIKGFLDLSRLESGKLRIKKENFILNDLIKEIISDLNFTTEGYNIVFTPHEPINIHADHDKIGQVLENILNNAIKYSDTGSRIIISCKKTFDEICVSVEDQGIGIKPEEAEKLFDRYYRSADDRLRTISGFGIGLYISGEIIRLHDGKIWVESKEKGSSFFFTLPIKK